MQGQFDMQNLWDFSWKGCLQYTNLIFPFKKPLELSNHPNKQEIFKAHIELAHKFLDTQNDINDYLDFWSNSMKKIDKEIWSYLNSYDSSKEIIACNWTNPSIKLDNDFRKIIEFCALRLQDVARISLQIMQCYDEIQKPNLVQTYEKKLRELFPNDSSLIEMLDDDSNWLIMLKELRNEGWWHAWWDKNWRELFFHKMDIAFVNWLWSRPNLQIPAFEFNGSKWRIIIDDFDAFFQILMHNIFDLSIDWLVFAYAYKSWVPAWILKNLIQWTRIDDKDPN